MEKWNQDLCIKAWNFASVAHQGQMVPGTEVPYINHVGNVAMEAMGAIVNSECVKRPDLLIPTALLHDVIEDTRVTHDSLVEEFGCAVADGVLALTKNSELESKAAMMQDSIERIKEQPKEIWMVKLCDRITNLQPPPSHWNSKKIEKYRDEAKLILEELGLSCEYLADRLESKINDYSKYIKLPKS
ncbi:MAG: bifunctional (p)ppGpp synthetase/guanosine-3',5'-bis(diphosphate) 3'-pyrophosphohydrolase [Desulfobulbaceae bacterium]|nr:bifunctional (p)ppGpp synthetase/guanosine-3',5'-bis(diphosphate) 3'-pyrophosphohydrolase [Desulfobulbaceae bacterium]